MKRMQIRKATVDKIEDDKDGKSIAYLKPDNPAREDPVRALDPGVIVEMDPIFGEANEMLHPTYEHLKVRGKGPRIKAGDTIELRITIRL
jgi:hypothetical protein